MKIGYACMPLTTSARTNRRLTIKKFSEKLFLEVLAENLIDLKIILQNNEENNINLFRISSDIVPLGSHSVNEIKWHEHFKNELNEIGEYIKKSVCEFQCIQVNIQCLMPKKKR